MQHRASISILAVVVTAASFVAVSMATEPSFLGQVTMRKVTCPPGGQGGAVCYVGSVSCPGESSVVVRIKYHSATSTLKGTVVLATGGPGNKNYDMQANHGVSLVNELNAAGYATAQISWGQNWAAGRNGWGSVSRRPAAVMRWIYRELHQGSEVRAFCATGNSGGSAQIGYSITHHGLDDILDAVIPTSGPPVSRIDMGCLCESDVQVDTPCGSVTSLCYESREKTVMDSAYAGTPCAKRTAATLRADSVYSADADLDYPRTSVVFIFGRKDSGPSVVQGKQWAQAITSNVRVVCLNNVGHAIANRKSGKTAILDAILEECHVHGCLGDANNDGKVDALDLRSTASHLGCVVGSGIAECDAADVNGDGVVDPRDVNLVSSRQGKACR